jgi:transposase-like protein
MKGTSKPDPEQTMEWLKAQPRDVKVSMLLHHLEITRIYANELLEEEVRELAGTKYSREKPYNGRYNRWGTNPGSIRIGAQSIPIEVPRVYDREEQHHRSLEVYEQMKQMPEQTEKVMNAVLLGLGTRNYSGVVDTLNDSFGLSKTQISEAFIERSAEALREFSERSFAQNTFVALFIDGKSQQKQQIVIVLGIDAKGEKYPLGFVQTTTENAQSIKDLLHNLVERGLQFDKGLLILIDGGKGLRKAIEDVFGPYAVVARCQLHKRKNVVRYLPEQEQSKWSNRLAEAYRIPEYAQAKEKLLQLREELSQINISAAASLDEGFEECLTLHRLGIAEQFQVSFSTTNCIESLNSLITRFTDNVKNWQNSEQRHRWIAVALLDIERRLGRVVNARNLPLMQLAVGNEVQRRLQALQGSEQGSAHSAKKRT